VSLTYSKLAVHHFSPHRLSGLRYLLLYALSHQHSKGWIGPLTLLMQKGGHVDG
jgi:hypothetical protein